MVGWGSAGVGTQNTPALTVSENIQEIKSAQKVGDGVDVESKERKGGFRMTQVSNRGLRKSTFGGMAVRLGF